MLILKDIFLFAGAVLIQLKLIPLFSVAGVTPDLVLILVLSVTFRAGRIAGIVAGFFSGIAIDAFSTGLVGTSSLANVIAAFIAGVWAAEQNRRAGVILGQLLATLLIRDLIYFWFLTIGTVLSFWDILFMKVIPHTLYTMVFLAMGYLMLPRSFRGRRHEFGGY